MFLSCVRCCNLVLISCSHVLRCYNIVFVESLQSRAKPDVLCTRLWNHEKPERADVRDKSDKSEQISLNDLISMETKCRKVALVTGHCLVHHKTVHQVAQCIRRQCINKTVHHKVRKVQEIYCISGKTQQTQRLPWWLVDFTTEPKLANCIRVPK